MVIKTKTGRLVPVSSTAYIDIRENESGTVSLVAVDKANNELVHELCEYKDKEKANVGKSTLFGAMASGDNVYSF